MIILLVQILVIFIKITVTIRIDIHYLQYYKNFVGALSDVVTEVRRNGVTKGTKISVDEQTRDSFLEYLKL